MRRFLVWLADAATGREREPFPPEVETHQEWLAAWLAGNDLGPLAYHLLRRSNTRLASCLRVVAMATAARNLSHFEILDRVRHTMNAARLPIVLLKGAALAEVTYGEYALRPMSDVDIWVRDRDMARAVALLKENGFCRAPLNPDRPPALQRHAGGEIQFRPQDGSHGLIELHWSPFPGWWNRLAANVDEQAVWERAEAFGNGRHALRLSAEDSVLQLAFHVAVNHFGEPALRGLMDIALTSRTRKIDWLLVAARARQWSLATMTWTVLDLVDRLFDAPGVDVALDALRPWRPRRALIEQFVNSASVLDGPRRVEQRGRFLLLLALVDHYPDMGRLVWRTLWPQREWLSARYRGSAAIFGTSGCCCVTVRFETARLPSKECRIMSVPFYKRISARDDVLCRGLDGESVLLNLATEQYFGLDEVGTQMWSVLTSSRSVHEGFETLSREYDVDAEALRKDVRRFLDDLLSCGLIDVHGR